VRKRNGCSGAGSDGDRTGLTRPDLRRASQKGERGAWVFVQWDSHFRGDLTRGASGGESRNQPPKGEKREAPIEAGGKDRGASHRWPGERVDFLGLVDREALGGACSERELVEKIKKRAEGKPPGLGKRTYRKSLFRPEKS